jgi:hypothetical protein
LVRRALFNRIVERYRILVAPPGSEVLGSVDSSTRRELFKPKLPEGHDLKQADRFSLQGRKRFETGRVVA